MIVNNIEELIEKLKDVDSNFLIDGEVNLFKPIVDKDDQGRRRTTFEFVEQIKF